MLKDIIGSRCELLKEGIFKVVELQGCFELKTVSLTCLVCTAYVNPSPCRTCGTIIEVIPRNPKAKILDVHLIRSTQRRSTNAIVLNLRVILLNFPTLSRDANALGQRLSVESKDFLHG